MASWAEQLWKAWAHGQQNDLILSIGRWVLDPAARETNPEAEFSTSNLQVTVFPPRSDGSAANHALARGAEPARSTLLDDPRPTNRWSAVRGSLNAVELRVLTTSGHQLVVGADLHEPGPIEHDDEIRHSDC